MRAGSTRLRSRISPTTKSAQARRSVPARNLGLRASSSNRPSARRRAASSQRAHRRRAGRAAGPRRRPPARGGGRVGYGVENDVRGAAATLLALSPVGRAHTRPSSSVTARRRVVVVVAHGVERSAAPEETAAARAAPPRGRARGAWAASSGGTRVPCTVAEPTPPDAPPAATPARGSAPPAAAPGGVGHSSRPRSKRGE